MLKSPETMIPETDSPETFGFDPARLARIRPSSSYPVRKELRALVYSALAD